MGSGAEEEKTYKNCASNKTQNTHMDPSPLLLKGLLKHFNTLLTLKKTPIARMLAVMPSSPVREAQMPIMVKRYTGGAGTVTRSRELEAFMSKLWSLILPAS